MVTKEWKEKPEFASLHQAFLVPRKGTKKALYHKRFLF